MMDQLFFNGEFLTQNDDIQSPEAVLLSKAGTIKAVGSYEEVFARQDTVCQARDLQGQTLMAVSPDASETALAQYMHQSAVDVAVFAAHAVPITEGQAADLLIIAPSLASVPGKGRLTEMIKGGKTIFKRSQAGRA